MSMSSPSYTRVAFSDLVGWGDDNHTEALNVFRSSCTALSGEGWQNVCSSANDATDARAFFEDRFVPVLIEDGQTGLFTGYYEPELPGSRTRTGRYTTPVYSLPDEAKDNAPWLARRDLIESGVLDQRGLELAWIEHPVDLFFLQVQGSGRIRLPDGDVMRVGYAGTNGHPYRSIGRRLIEQGLMSVHEASAEAIKAWVHARPAEGTALLYHNASYVFFREVSHVPAEQGPLGAMNRSITALRSIAVDPAFVPLGAPVWIEKAGAAPMHRLMIAQDTGSAIKGAQRADVFYGTGNEAGQRAGRIKDAGRMVVLLPVPVAETLTRQDAP